LFQTFFLKTISYVKMKKKTLLFPLAAIAGYLLLSSYSTGIGGMSPSYDYTGSQGATCANCHGGASSTTSASFSFVDKATSLPVTNGKYTPGKTYTVTLKGVNTGSLVKFGYQAEPVTAAMAAAGTLTVTQSSQQVSTMNGGRKLIESTTRLTASSASNLAASFDWIAPIAGTGTVTFYGVVNAVNGTGGQGGDAVSPSTNSVLTENTASIESVNGLATIQLYPNPATDIINLRLEGVQVGGYLATVYNLSGQQVAATEFGVVNMKSIQQINTANLPSGLYQLVVASEGWNKVISFVKN
jgi:hypothetical protein